MPKYYDKTPPRGKNSLNAMGLFEQRLYYKNDIYPVLNRDGSLVSNPVDLWYDRHLFGKVDVNGNSIYIREPFLKQLTSGDQNVWALDFVVDAFNKFREYFLFLNRKVTEGTAFEFLHPKRGWLSIEESYKNWIENVYQIFINQYLSKNKRSEQLISFNSFMKLLHHFIEINSPHLPFTLTQYLYSPFSSPMTSGLIIEISEDEHGNDIKKFNKLLNDENFNCYANAAERFGFKVDKNAPSRLIADIKSPIMQKYMEKYPKDPGGFNIPSPVPPDPPEFPFPEVGELNPFESGDFVYVGLIQPQSPESTGKWVVLRDHTDLLNRRHIPGERPRRGNYGTLVETINGEEVIVEHFNAFSALKNHFGENFSKIIVGEVINPSPTVQERIDAGTFSFGLARGGVGNHVSGDPDSWNSWKDGIAIIRWISLPQMTPGGDPDIPLMPELITGVKINSNGEIIQDGLLYGYGRKGEDSVEARTTYDTRIQRLVAQLRTVGDGWVQEYGTDVERMAAEGFIMEVPLDALHLFPKTSNDIARFNRRLSWNQRINLWELESNAQLQKWENTIWRDHLLNVDRWSNQQSEHAAEINYFNSIPSLTFNNIFDQRYVQSYKSDLSTLREICMQFYYSYSSKRPFVTKWKTKLCGPTKWTTEPISFSREQISRKMMLKKYPDAFWLRQYIKIRATEGHEKFSLETINKIISKAFLIFRSAGLDNALVYVNERFKNLSLTMI